MSFMFGWSLTAFLVTLVKFGDCAGSTPNIIFFILDDFGYGDLSATYAEYETPNLDEFFGESIELRSHYIGLMCTPSRMQILTGRYAWNMALSSFDTFGDEVLGTLPAGIPTIAELLKEYTDYDTYLVGKWHEGDITWEATPTYRGFDHFYGFYGGVIHYTNKTNGKTTEYIDWRDDESVDYATQYVYSTYSHRDRIVTIINEHFDESGANPFYIYAALQAPHKPLQYVESNNMETCARLYTSNTNSYDYNRYLYCLNILAVDQIFGETVEALKDNGIWEDTLVVFTTDNGASYSAGGCNFPYRGGKTQFFEGGINTLALVGGGYIPQDQRGWKRGGLMHGADWTPTILSLAGVDMEMVSDNLLNNHYQPILDKINKERSMPAHIDDAFDGFDLSQWLIYGDESDNNRSSCGLSINDWNSTDGAPVNIGLVFVSTLTNHKYKLINGMQNNGDWCSYCIDEITGLPYRCEIESFDFDEYFLFDLTLDLNETTNLLSPTSLNMKDYFFFKENEKNDIFDSFINGDRNVRIKYMIEINNKTKEYENKHNLNLLKQQKGVNGSEYSILKEEINDIWDYFLYKDSSDITDEIWQEGYEITLTYMDNDMYNDYTVCQQNSFTSQSNPANLDGAWGPWFTFDEYKQKFKHYCQDYMNDVLYELYITQYDGSK